VTAGEVVIAEFIREQGFDLPPAAARAREVLESLGLTRPGKRAFTSAKLPAAEAALRTLLRVCSDACLRVDRSGPNAAREVAFVTKRSCEVCSGSNNQRAAIEAERLLRQRRIQNVLIIGGSPAIWDEMRDVFAGSGLDIRVVDGTSRSHGAREADANKQWAQLIVILGASELRHAVSNLYSKEVPEDVRVLHVSRRGVEAICQEIVRSYT
jgi:hypothetical protein